MDKQNKNIYLAEDVKARSNDLYANTKYQIIRERLSDKKSLKILDAGCGSGELAILLAKDGHEVTGIDTEEEFIAIAQDNAKKNNVNISFIASGIEMFTAVTPFDCLVSTDVIEHIEDDQSVIKKLMQLVKENGLIIIAVPAIPWLYGYHDKSIGHYRRYSADSLKVLLEPYAKKIEIKYFGWTFIPLCILYSKIFKKAYPLAESGDTKKNPLITQLLKIIIIIDKVIPFPIGTSIIAKSIKK